LVAVNVITEFARRDSPPNLDDIEFAKEMSKQDKRTPEEIQRALTKDDPTIVLANNLFANAKKAGGDLYAPLWSLEAWVKFEADCSLLISLFNHPLTPLARRTAILNDLTAHLNTNKTAAAFLQELNVARDMRSVKAVMRHYQKLVCDHNKDVIVTVTSAQALNPQQLAKVQENLKKHVGKGEKLIVRENVDPKIIGGLIIDGQKMYQDLSVRYAFERMEQNLRANV
jgi:ATP synthase F1 delta subunit